MPQRRAVKGERINLTFRKVVAPVAESGRAASVEEMAKAEVKDVEANAAIHEALSKYHVLMMKHPMCREDKEKEGQKYQSQSPPNERTELFAQTSSAFVLLTLYTGGAISFTIKHCWRSSFADVGSPLLAV